MFVRVVNITNYEPRNRSSLNLPTISSQIIPQFRKPPHTNIQIRKLLLKSITPLETTARPLSCNQTRTLFNDIDSPTGIWFLIFVRTNNLITCFWLNLVKIPRLSQSSKVNLVQWLEVTTLLAMYKSHSKTIPVSKMRSESKSQKRCRFHSSLKMVLN